MRLMMRFTPVVGTIALLVGSAAPVAAQAADGPIDLQAHTDEFAALAQGGVAAVTIRDGVVSTAAADIADTEGDRLAVDTPPLEGGATVPMVYGFALQLVDERLHGAR